MQCGFAMLEAGIVQPKNATNILFKNMIDASLAAICFWLLGYGFAYGTDVGGFIGSDNFAIVDINNANGGWQGWFFQWAFAGAAATIVAGSVCERAKIEAYFCYSIILTVFIYPIVVHWGWGAGFLSAWGAFPDGEGNARPIFSKTDSSNGMIDFAGSGVVHMVGGFSGLMGAIVVGPRTGRFVDGQCVELYAGNKILQSLGVFILWFGWYGFNCGSTLMISGGAANVAGKVAVTTTLAASSGAIGATFLSKIIMGQYDISIGLNGVLAGLVSITANCSVVDPWHAVIIGMFGAVVFFLGHYLLIKLKIDDPCDATVVHGFCGYWGLLATGIFCTDPNVQYAAYPNVNEACKSGEQFGVQVVGGLAIIAWTCATAGLTFVVVNATLGMRVSSEVEDAGLDVSEHAAFSGFDLSEHGAYMEMDLDARLSERLSVNPAPNNERFLQINPQRFVQINPPTTSVPRAPARGVRLPSVEVPQLHAEIVYQH
jgi:Amt family ammonium transporter